MMVYRQVLFLVWSAIFLSACTSHVYTGRINTPDTTGDEREVVLYWTNTSPFIGERKAGPAVLMTECGDRIRFDERPDGIIFRGTPNEDQLVNQGPATEAEFECGRFIGHDSFVDISDGVVSLSILCEPVSGEFSVFQRSYIAARAEPYNFGMTSAKYWSVFGSEKGIPPPPDCKDPGN